MTVHSKSYAVGDLVQLNSHYDSMLVLHVDLKGRLGVIITRDIYDLPYGWGATAVVLVEGRPLRIENHGFTSISSIVEESDG